MFFYIKKMIERSNNGESNRDCVDINQPFLPVFITNPPPWFRLSQKIKILILYNYEVNNVNSLFEFQKHLLKNIQRRKNKMSTVSKRLSITKRQNTFFNVIYSLKEKMKGKYIKEFNEIN